MERRQFIKSSCQACLLGASGVLLAELVACSPGYQIIKTEVVDNSLDVPLSAFAQSNIQFVRPRGWSYDLVVQKKADDHFESMLLQCTHQQNQVVPTGNGFLCHLHGSQYDKDGNVTKGPAELPLRKFKTEIQKDKLIIHLKG
ncbi:MAG: hypothetical protein C5B59_02005 [Bacteroidetes bacterium]|nr:MAG: hypothetical protein C5B59_02005 [Bacteroidota bacterium]